MSAWVNVTTDNITDYLEDIVEIENHSFISPWSRKAFWEEVRNPISQLWVMREDRKALGYICFWAFCGEMQLLDVAVHPLKRNQGLGRLLMRKMLNQGALQKAKAVWLEVRPSNFTALKLYQSLGFQEIGRRPGYYRDTNEEAIVMRFMLAGDES